MRYQMKKFIAALICSFSIAACFAAETKIYFDRFEFPLVRTSWLKFDPQNEAWTKDLQLPAAGVRWRVRYSGEKNVFKSLTVINSKGKQIFQDNSCQKATWVNLSGADTYTLKVTGNAHSKLAYLVLDTYDNEDKKLPAWRSTLMPSWRFLRVKHEAVPGGGVKITPAGDVPGIYTLLSNLSQKYRAEFTVTSAEAQTVKVLVSWRKKTGKGRDRVIRDLAVTPGKPATVSVEFAPTTTPVEVALRIEKELIVNSFNVYEIK